MKISSSWLTTALRCPRETYYAHILRRVSRFDSQESLGGTYFHALVAHSRGADPATPSPALDDDNRALLDLIFAGWLARWEWHEKAEAWKPNVTCHNHATYPHELRGEFDAIRANGELYELKTTKSDISPTGGYWDRLTLDIQVSFYSLMGAPRIHYDVVRIPTERPLKATPLEKREVVTRGPRKGELYKGQRAEDEPQEAWLARVQEMVAADPDAYYQRRVVTRSPAELDEFKKTIITVAKAFDIYSDVSHYPMASQRSTCNRFGGKCPYLPVCERVADISDPSLFKDSEYNRLV